MKNFVLLGLPGCGKTTLGRAVAKKLGMGFLDLDALIESRAGKSIPDIFAQQGEAAFRDMETDAVRIAASQHGMVISTGGGVVERKENIPLLRQNGILIFVDRPARQIAGQMKTANRPVMQGDSNKLFELEKRRRPLYQQAMHYRLESQQDRRYTEKALLALCHRIHNTSRYCVIGDPIGHSLSPQIHLPVLEAYLEKPVYEKCHVPAEQLPAFIKEARQSWQGFNATMPHKAALLPLLDEVDADAKALGSVNTVVNRGGKLYGYSTDGAGFFSALAEKGISPKGKTITMLGAGGAAAAVAVKAASLGAARIILLARTVSKTEALVQRIQKAVPGAVAQAGSMEQAAEYAAKTDILINATPLGMEGTGSQFADFDFLKPLPKEAAVCDLIYKPRPTLLLQKAAEQGHTTMDGLSMLIYQGLLADSLYLDTPIDCKAEFQRLEKLLFSAH